MNLCHAHVEIQDQIALIRIERPEALNALNAGVLRDLRAVFGDIGPSRGVRACILTGAGEKAFVAGADIRELEQLTPAGARELAVAGQKLMQTIEDFDVPVIAAVNGFALGGGLELALACDVIVASESARWGLPEVTLGVIPGYGGTQRLSRNVGRTIARRVTLGGDIFTARQGYDWGLFAQVVPADQLMPTARALAATLAQRAPRALALAKRAINRGADVGLAEGLALEADLFAEAFGTKDKAEGTRAFLEKRAPHFKGK